MNIIETNLTFKDNHSNRVGSPKGIVLHHAAAKTCTVEQVHAWHIANGWAGIGYHLFVRKDGSVYRGRPENWIGAHAGNYNDCIGVCCEGNFMDETMPQAQKNAVVEVLKYLYGKYGVMKVYRHGEVNATGCPGTNYPFEEIVTLSKQQGSAPTPETSAPDDGYVLQFQKALMSAGFSLPVYGADGIWGNETASAAKKAQIGLDDDGPLVEFMQNMLMTRGYKLPKYGADGIIGAETLSQLEAFQKASGITVDGICGINTWKKLLEV